MPLCCILRLNGDLKVNTVIKKLYLLKFWFVILTLCQTCSAQSLLLSHFVPFPPSCAYRITNCSQSPAQPVHLFQLEIQLSVQSSVVVFYKLLLSKFDSDVWLPARFFSTVYSFIWLWYIRFL